MAYFFIAFVSAVVCSVIASKIGKPMWIALFVGFLFPILGIAIYLLMLRDYKKGKKGFKII